jgi:hypothetical protein
MIGGLALPPGLITTFKQFDADPGNNFLAPSNYFQWQNEFLSKIIYPMRKVKLREFLIYYQEVDVWAHYKNKDINNLTDEVAAYKKAWEVIAAESQKEYKRLRDYFLKGNARSDYSNFDRVDEEELIEIDRFRALFAQGWPKDIRGESSFVSSMHTKWKHHCIRISDRIKSLDRRHDTMDPKHPKYITEGEELVFKETVTLPMAEQELDQLDSFFETYGKLEERKLAWYKLTKSDPTFSIPEEQFIETFPAERKVTIQDIARWKVDEYKHSLADKDQYELLELIYQRFQKEPQRFPPWLQYMVVHFSGMRYASAHGSWADPRDLLARLHALEIDAEIAQLDDDAVAKMCTKKIVSYHAADEAERPKLALEQDRKWLDQLHWHLADIASTGPKTRRSGLIALLKTENEYELMGKSTLEIHDLLLSMKDSFHPWIWHEIVRLTELRTSQVSDLHWEVLTPKQVAEELHEPENNHLRKVVKDWAHLHQAAWRDEHGRTLELIVTRAVCNETAEHCQHVRGHLPPGGLTPKPNWYIGHEAKGDLPGAYFVKPTSEKDYTQGASILWLRFVNQKPDAWQIAKPIKTKQGVGLLPLEFLKNRSKEKGEWIYDMKDMITRTRTTILPDKQKLVEVQWLRWIHEATVAEVAETVDGMMVISFETSLPTDDSDTSSVGIHKMPLSWHLSDGKEDQYNRSFVGYVPDGQIPFDRLAPMLDWEKILR